MLPGNPIGEPEIHALESVIDAREEELAPDPRRRRHATEQDGEDQGDRRQPDPLDDRPRLAGWIGRLGPLDGLGSLDGLGRLHGLGRLPRLPRLAGLDRVAAHELPLR